MNSRSCAASLVLVFLVTTVAFTTEIRFENVGLSMAQELSGLNSVGGYGSYVTGVSTGGYSNSFARGSGWTPNVALTYSAGNDLKTVSTWRDKWEGGSGVNYLLDGDVGEPYYYWYTFTPRRGAGVIVNSLDLNGLGDRRNRIDWTLYADTKVGKVLARGTTGTFAGDKSGLHLGMREPYFGVVVLELKHTGTRTSLAVDNLNFDEVPRGNRPPTLVRVGRRKQLFVDDYVIDSMSHVSRELGKIVKLNQGRPLLERDQPWERACTFYGTAVHDGSKFQMWYRASINPFALGYAESRDGVNWTKPKLGLVKFGGTKQNNIVDVDLGLAYAFSCFIDPNETDPAHKYKCCWGHPRKIRACLGHSADGIRWTPYNAGEPVTHRAADTHSQLLWDPTAEVYRLFTRTDYQRAMRAEMEVRGSRAMTNPSLRQDPAAWKLGRQWHFDRTPKEYRRRQVYSMTDWIYAGVHFGLITLFEYPDDKREGPRDLHQRHEKDVLAFYLATSRDAENWDFRWVDAGQPLVPRGPSGSFDKDMVIPPSNVVTHDNRHWIYYSGSNERHGMPRVDAAIGGATLRLDGFVALRGTERGVVTTKPFRLHGDRLEINADARQGSVQVAVLDAAGKILPQYVGRPLRTDGIKIVPKWDGADDLSRLRGRVIRLRFGLRQAKLYAFQIR